MGSGPSKHDDATALLCGPLGESLRGWPLERVRMANRVFRHSGQGFLVYVEDVVRLIDVPRQTAVAICRAMSRNPRKDSVNVLTLLSVWTTLINAGSASLIIRCHLFSGTLPCRQRGRRGEIERYHRTV